MSATADECSPGKILSEGNALEQLIKVTLQSLNKPKDELDLKEKGMVLQKNSSGSLLHNKSTDSEQSSSNTVTKDDLHWTEPELVKMACTQLEVLEQNFPNIHECMHLEEGGLDTGLDLGRFSEQILLRDKALAYKTVGTPLETGRLVVVRTGECSGQFVLQVSQRLDLKSKYSQEVVDEIEQLVDRVNKILIRTKQKMAREESKILGAFLAWLCFSFAGAFLSSFYLHYTWAFLFMFLFIVGSYLFYRRFKRIQDDQLLMKAHLALSLALRADNQRRFSRNAQRNNRNKQNQQVSAIEEEKLRENHLYISRPGYLAKWIELLFPLPQPPSYCRNRSIMFDEQDLEAFRYHRQDYDSHRRFFDSGVELCRV